MLNAMLKRFFNTFTTIKMVLFLEKRINVTREKVILTITMHFLNSAKFITLI